MTTRQLIEKSGITEYNDADVKRLGERISDLAKQKKITVSKVRELVPVNDYPDSFIPDMETKILGYFTEKAWKL